MLTDQQRPGATADDSEIERALDEVRARIARASARHDELEAERRRTDDELDALWIANVAVLEGQPTPLPIALLMGIVLGTLVSGVLAMFGI